MWPVYIQASVCGNDTVIVESDEWELQWAVIDGPVLARREEWNGNQRK
jgi:hypothetical protein